MRFLPDPPQHEPAVHPDAIPYAPALTPEDMDWLRTTTRLLGLAQERRHPGHGLDRIMANGAKE